MSGVVTLVLRSSDASSNEHKTEVLETHRLELGDLDKETVDVILGIIRNNAESDYKNFPRLSRAEHDSYTNTFTSHLVSVPESTKPTNPTVLVIKRLKLIGDNLHEAMFKDPVLSKGDEDIINSSDLSKSDQTDSSNTNLFDFSRIKAHFLEVLGGIFPRERLIRTSLIRLLIDLTLVTTYCYVFCNRLCEHAKKVLKRLLPTFVFEILCKIVSYLREYLATIGWTAILESLGGWVELAKQYGLLRVTKEMLLPLVPRWVHGPYGYFGIALLFTAIGAYQLYSQQ